MSGTGDVRADIARWRAASNAEIDDDGAPRRTILIVASFTANPIEPALGVALLDHAPPPADIRHADYNQLFQICLEPARFGAENVDDVVVIWRIEDVFERDFHAWTNRSADAFERLVDGARSLGRAVADFARSIEGSVIAADAPVPVGYGLDHHDPSELTALVELQRAVNRAFDDGLGDDTVERFRLAAIEHAYGTANAFDRRNWQMYRQPFTAEFAHAVGRGIADVIAARTTAPPKVLVLDCDGTLWGGVAVDDGVGALECSDAFPGFSYRSFQLVAQRLRHRGVLLALVSKNDPETVEQAFAEIDGMVLTDDDIAGRRVSWGPKPQAIAELADEFNLGLDSFVFVDDSPFEIGSVADQLPSVRTVQVPEDIEELPDLLAESGWFRHARVTSDDRERTARMHAARDRTSAATTMSHDDFLASLDLRVRIIAVGPSELTRVTQLINKTNQFNLTTIRRSEADVRSLLDDHDHRVFAFSVDDRFGEYGIVAVTIARLAPDAWWLDTMLMSCRVLGRGVETAVLASTVHELRRIHDAGIVGRFAPSDRNAMVATLLPDHGFVVADDAAAVGHDTTFSLPTGRDITVPSHITVSTT